MGSITTADLRVEGIEGLWVVCQSKQGELVFTYRMASPQWAGQRLVLEKGFSKEERRK